MAMELDPKLLAEFMAFYEAKRLREKTKAISVRVSATMADWLLKQSGVENSTVTEIVNRALATERKKLDIPLKEPIDEEPYDDI